MAVETSRSAATTRRDERRARDRENDDVPDVDARERRDGRARGDDAREDDVTREGVRRRARARASWTSVRASKSAAAAAAARARADPGNDATPQNIETRPTGARARNVAVALVSPTTTTCRSMMYARVS